MLKRGAFFFSLFKKEKIVQTFKERKQAWNFSKNLIFNILYLTLQLEQSQTFYDITQ